MPYTDDKTRNEMFTYLLGFFRIHTLVELGTLEGETLRYFNRFVQRGVGCDLDLEAIERGRARGGVEIVCQDSLDFLKSVVLTERTAFYLDSNWLLEWPGIKELKLIKERWPKHVAIVNDVGMSRNPWFFGRTYELAPEVTEQTFKELIPMYTQILYPNYTVHRKTCGYVILNAFEDPLPETGYLRLN